MAFPLINTNFSSPQRWSMTLHSHLLQTDIQRLLRTLGETHETHLPPLLQIEYLEQLRLVDSCIPSKTTTEIINFWTLISRERESRERKGGYQDLQTREERTRSKRSRQQKTVQRISWSREWTVVGPLCFFFWSPAGVGSICRRRALSAAAKKFGREILLLGKRWSLTTHCKRREFDVVDNWERAWMDKKIRYGATFVVVSFSWCRSFWIGDMIFCVVYSFDSVPGVFEGTSFNCRFHLVNVVVFVYGESLMPFSSYEKRPQISIIRWYSVEQLFCRSRYTIFGRLRPRE